MKKRYQRLGVMGLTAVMACTGTVLPVLAGQASVAVDENMYVNLDYYGNVDRVNVVKGCDLNGQTTITDYGDLHFGSAQLFLWLLLNLRLQIKKKSATLSRGRNISAGRLYSLQYRSFKGLLFALGISIS